MAGLENLFLWLSLAGIVVTIILAIMEFLARRKAMLALAKKEPASPPQTAAAGRNSLGIAGDALTILTILFISLTLVFRGILAGHGPFSDMYEFALAFAWGIVVMGAIFQWRYKTAAVKNAGFIIALLLLIFAIVEHTSPPPLVPALQQSTLLSVHVASGVVAYGTLTIGFGAAILFLIQNRRNSLWLPDKEVLDKISYQAVVIGFPFLTLLIVLGALWADIAWGKYWSWDPKETASLVTWLLYAAYLHARVMRGWRGRRAAILLIVSFAAILLTFFGNYIFTGLHTYNG
ncbi:MAG: c-type cytochrome biogenesis protein CcsB [Chloroflexi bacterium]|nr:c-type cytochrome biogenesis protein CcsB [Chloroflexota bacterium]